MTTKSSANNTQPPQFLLRLPQVLERIPVSRATYWRWCAEGKAPKPIKIGPRTTVWKSDEISAFIEQLVKEGSSHE